MIIFIIIVFSFNVINGIVLAGSSFIRNSLLWSWPWVWARAFHKTGKHYDSDDEEIGLHEEHEHDHKNTNVNLRASFIHVLGEALKNVGILIEGIIVFFFKKLSIADLICTYIFGIIVGLTTIHILKDCIFVLMEGSPFAVDIEKLKKIWITLKELKKFNLYVWSLSMGKISLSCHICCDNSQKTWKKRKKK